MLTLDVFLLKAARGLLGWSADELAVASGASLASIRHFERGKTQLSQTNEEKIVQALRRAGVEFIDGGVVRRRISSYVLNSYLDLLEDISLSVPPGGEVLKHCVDDRRSTPEVIEKVAQMRRADIRERLTISDENTYITGKPEDYRRIPAAYFGSSEVIIVYLNKVAFFVDDKVLVNVSDTLAKVFRDQFEYWWQHGKRLDV